MKKLLRLAAAAAALSLACAAGAQSSLTEAQARAVIEPWYAMFNQPFQGDVAAQHDKVVADNYRTCWNPEDVPGGCWGKEQSIKTIANFAKTVPDMRFNIKEVLVSGNRVVVRGAVTGTSSGDFFGVAHTGKSFKILAIDIQTIQEGKITQTYHLENWLLGVAQLWAQ